MQTCKVSIPTAITNNTFTPLSSGVSVPFSINPNTNYIFRLNSANSQSVYINFALSSYPSTINMSLTVYSYPALLIVATATVNQVNSTLTVDLTSGQFFICLRTFSGNYSGMTNAVFTGYANTAFLTSNSYDGTNMQSTMVTTTLPVIVKCNQVIIYKLEYGELPEGLTLNDAGFITGVLPLLDCDPVNADVPPGNNLYYSDTVTSYPIGVQYHFAVRLSLQSDETVFDIKNYCISIVNDWDKTKEPVRSIAIVESTIDVSESNVPRTILPPTLCDNPTILDKNTINISLNSIDSDKEVTLKELKGYQENSLNMDDVLYNKLDVTKSSGTYSRSEAVLIPNDVVDVRTYIESNMHSSDFSGYDMSLIQEVVNQYRGFTIIENDGLKFAYIEDNSINTEDKAYKFEMMHIEQMSDYSMLFTINWGDVVKFTLS